jgi:hypothetical protein
VRRDAFEMRLRPLDPGSPRQHLSAPKQGPGHPREEIEQKKN